MAERRLISSLLEAVAERLDTFDTVAAGANAPDPVANKATENNDDRGDIMLNAMCRRRGRLAGVDVLCLVFW